LAEPPRTTALSRLCWLLLPTVLALCVCELALALLGLGAAEQQVGRGFSRDVSYLLPDPQRAGAWRTQMFQGEEPEISIAPKGDARRVVLFGGSNTARFPGGNLRQFLDAAGPDRWEVVNLGRSGYGSARVLVLFEQALALEPDLVVIYSGHNEFVELGFEMQIEREWGALERPLVTAASKLRTFHALVAAFETGATAPAGRSPVAPERSAFEHDKFRSFQYAQTLRRLQAYEANLDRMCALAHERGVPVLLGTLFSNDLSAPFVSNIDPALGAEARRLAIEGLMRVHAAWPARWKEILPREPPVVLNLGDWEFGDGSGGAAPALRALPEPLAARGPLWADPSKWRARTHELMSAWARFHAGPTPDEREALPKLASELEGVLARVPDHPLAHYLLGLCRLASGEPERARESLELAARYDRAPLKASSLTNEIVRRVAGRHPGVALFDFDELVRARSPDRIVGFELMQDHCHAHADTYLMLMRDLAEIIAREWAASSGARAAAGGRR